MRRIGVIVMALWMLCICGCKKTTPPKTAAFSCTVTITAEETTIRALLTRAGIGQLRLECLSPPTLSGLCFVTDGDGVTLQKDGLTFSVAADKLPKAALALRLLRVLDEVSLQKEMPQSGRIDGFAEKIPFVLEFDKSTGALTELTLPDEKLSFIFSDFSV